MKNIKISIIRSLNSESPKKWKLYNLYNIKKKEK